MPSKTFVLQQLRNAQRKIKSVQFIYLYTAQLTSTVPQSSTAAASTTTYEFAFSSKGDKCYLKPLPDSRGSDQENMVSLFDSRRNYQIATIEFQGKTVNDCTFSRQNMGMALTPMDFGYFLGSLHWAAEALQPTPLAVHGYENSSFGPVLKVTARDQNGFTDTLYLAPNYDYLIAKWEIHTENGEIVEFLCDKAIQKKSVWIPIDGTRNWYTPSPQGLQLRAVSKVHVIAAQINDVPESLFTLHLLPSSRVYDRDHDVAYFVDNRGRWIADKRSTKTLSRHYFLAWLFIVSLTTLLVIVFGLIIGLKRRISS
ncbi:MAG TPA: hypothetical protein VKV18_07560 [Chthonomonas sp.]|uniref:hypothetical protein n=1 Tax=Chthonomonas sp. TaxID=2282153 RepID=UPI002B4B35B8|nr:hypothetical protein [Chthonomonas sp.]HLI48523.1 hypothetical protein [Chthonomonas sp.]